MILILGVWIGTTSNTTGKIPEEETISIPDPVDVPDPMPQETQIPNLTTIVQSNVTDWNPYSVLPPWQPPLNHSSIFRNPTDSTLQQELNKTYSGSVGLAAFAVGKELNVTNGPFSITDSVYPNISSPLDVWVKITIFDPWQQIIAEGGYNRGFPSQETQTMMIYREGRYYMSIEGEFATMDYTIKTADSVPVVSSAPTQVSDMGYVGEEDLV
ncbi:MAG: hypothetical protein LUQ50_07275 [Methanospirillum sp.]|uniref:hypothetical protein n=1 Tax=Methanospirillum sp. TaxID=45200 RepID=UPI00236D8565|nr:hypothetical protein [Methanospirillum sp.]MDD1728854.1 hypothetical protein [Methanospirillum sp.]